jgi:acyl carrier protein
MTREDILEGIVRSYQLSYAAVGAITEDSELAGDSLDAFHMAVDLEERFKITIEDDEILACKKVGDIVQLVLDKKAGNK